MRRRKHGRRGHLLLRVHADDADAGRRNADGDGDGGVTTMGDGGVGADGGVDEDGGVDGDAAVIGGDAATSPAADAGDPAESGGGGCSCSTRRDGSAPVGMLMLALATFGLRRRRD